QRLGRPISAPPAHSAMGALLAHITGGAEAATFQPMNVNFGLFPPLEADLRKGRKGKKARAEAHATRALQAIDTWYGETESLTTA
ncbi:MAG: FADH(2)-oxidizing methylenetetrahydrofolate--tRNA-(uracil(54)-C(5))-methyltransferase TrmFO, partial [Pseudomonadota bacterium]